MANDRYERDREGRDRPSSFDEDRYQRSRGGGWRDEDRHRQHGRDERGFFERASDEVSSWFSGEDRAPSRRRDEDDRGYSDRRRGSGGSVGRDHHERDREFGRGEYMRDHYGRDELRQTGSRYDRDRDGWRGERHESDERDYRPMAGDYGRSGREDFRDRDRDSQWERDPYRRSSFAGSAARPEQGGPEHDEWRRRHSDELDRDYDDYRRERQEHFHRDFSSWRERRQSKRQLLGRIREHMEVVGSDGEHVGTVDRVAGDRIILTKSDPEAGGVHHSLTCTEVDRVEDERVVLEVKAEEARQRWRDDDRGRALFEREDQGRAGPHILDRSFSGTYR